MRSDYSGPRYRDRLLQLVRVGLKNLREHGVADTWRKIGPALKSLRVYGSYCTFMRQARCTEEELAWQARRDLGPQAPTFSVIVPLFNTPEPFLRDMIESVLGQSYARWQLCLADASDDAHGHEGEVCKAYVDKDARIAYRKLQTNRGIAGNSNAALEMAEGDYVALLDHDDVLSPAALYEVACAVVEQGADFVYTDEAIFRSPDTGDVPHIHFKPDFAPDNLLSNNYICHLTAFRRSLLDQAGWFRDGFEGSQDHDLVLRVTAVARTIVHIPKVLYLWRSHPQSVAMTISAKPFAGESGKRAVSESLRARGMRALVESAEREITIYRCVYELTGEPRVSIVIPNCDHSDDLRACLESIQERSTYKNVEVIVVENNSRDSRTFDYYEEARRTWDNVRVVTWEGPFNWSAINNYGVRHATGSMILLLNNDTRVISPNWIQEMLMYAQRKDVGCVGAMLYYPNDTIQCAGVIVGGGDQLVSYAFEHVKRGQRGYAGKLRYAQNMSAVLGACMLMRRDVWDEIGGCDESFAVGYNDIDLCMRVRDAGYLVVWTPHAELYHFERKSRGTDDTPQKRSRAAAEVARFRQRWAAQIEAGDPYYNPNLGYGYFARRPSKGKR